MRTGCLRSNRECRRQIAIHTDFPCLRNFSNLNSRAANTQYLGKIGECTELAFQHCTNAARWSRSLAAKLRVCTQMIGFCRAFSLFAIRTHSAFSTHTASNTTGSSYPTGTCAMLQSSHAVRPERQIQKVLPNRSARVLEPRSSGVHLVVNTTTH